MEHMDPKAKSKRNVHFSESLTEPAKCLWPSGGLTVTLVIILKPLLLLFPVMVEYLPRGGKADRDALVTWLFSSLPLVSLPPFVLTPTWAASWATEDTQACGDLQWLPGRTTAFYGILTGCEENHILGVNWYSLVFWKGAVTKVKSPYLVFMPLALLQSVGNDSELSFKYLKYLKGTKLKHDNILNKLNMYLNFMAI